MSSGHGTKGGNSMRASKYFRLRFILVPLAILFFGSGPVATQSSCFYCKKNQMGTCNVPSLTKECCCPGDPG